MSSNAGHVDWERLVEYWAGELAETAEDTLEEHLMGCEACSALSARVASVTERMRALFPPLLTSERLAELLARGIVVVENPMRPGERRAVTFPAHADILLHRLGGLSLQGGERVSFVMRAEQTGQVLLQVEDAPCDREHGEVLVACQHAFSRMPADTVAEVRVQRAGGDEELSTYTILHTFEHVSAS